MDKLNKIDLQIAGLKKKKEQLRLKAADTLYRKLEDQLGESFSPELVLGMVIECGSSSSLQKDKWQELGATFFRRSPARKTPKGTAANQLSRAETDEDQKTHGN